MIDTTDDATLRRIFSTTRVIAVEGIVPDPAKPSNYVARFLAERGYQVIPVNAAHAGKEVLGQKILASFAEIPAEVKVDMVDIFRRSEHVPPVVEAALAHLPHLRTVWMQVGITNAAAAALARARGMAVVQDRCPKMDIPRLFGAQDLGEFAAEPQL